MKNFLLGGMWGLWFLLFASAKRMDDETLLTASILIVIAYVLLVIIGKRDYIAFCVAIPTALLLSPLLAGIYYPEGISQLPLRNALELLLKAGFTTFVFISPFFAAFGTLFQSVKNETGETEVTAENEL